MPHSMSLIATVAAAFGLALLLGIAAARARMPALVGYLVAGVIIGPATPGFVADMDAARQLAEMGVMLLMFGVGLRFSLSDLLAVRRIALPGAVVQMVLATALGMSVAALWGWTLGAGLVFGLALSVASTVVLLRALEAQGLLESTNGRIAVGWLIVQDVAMVGVLVFLPPLAGALGGVTANDTNVWRTFAVTLAELAAFVALMLLVGRRVFPWLLWQVTKTGSRELFTLCVIAAAITIAYGSAILFGVSFALGAFFAGAVLRESQFSQRAAEQTLPLRDAFAVLFFVAVGMLFDPRVLLEQPFRVLAVVGIILIGNSLSAGLIVLLFRYPLNTALTVAASLAQIGEFSFIVAALGLSLGVLSPEGQSLIVAGALISIALNPLVFRGVEPLQTWLRSRSQLARALERPDDPLAELPASTERRYLSKQVVLVGYGRVGRQIAATLRTQEIPFVVVEQNRDVVRRLRDEGVPAVSGNAVEPGVLIQAHIAHARMLVIATPDTVEVRTMVETARTLNPPVEVVIRTHNEEEAALLEQDGCGKVFFGERELARAMSGYVLEQLPAASSRTSRLT